MLWRLFTALIIAFWVLMTVLLVRVTYYPEGSQFAKVPPATIFKMFLDLGATQSQLHIYHGGKKVGLASLTPRRSGVAKENKSPKDYMMLMAGTLDKGALEFVNSQVIWHLGLELHGAESWGGMSGQVRLVDLGTTFDFTWPEGDSLPKFTLRGQGTYLDDKTLRMMMPFMSGPEGLKAPPGMTLPPGMKMPPAGSTEGALQLTAREGVVMLAGQKRRGYVMELKIMDQTRAKIFFTEAGELALVEMTDGWRALDPIIYGLVPEIEEPEE